MEKFRLARIGGGGVALTSLETEQVSRAFAVLGRVAENDCANPQAREAADILRQLDE